MNNDTYRTISTPTEAVYTELRSRFLAYACPVWSEDDVKVHLKDLHNRYHDARHICYAYILGQQAETFRASDDGEPSGTGGRPILGRIRSHDLTFTLVAVVRYFGGIQLGTARLGVAYKTAAATALEQATIDEHIIKARFRAIVPYANADAVMRTARNEGADIGTIECSEKEECIMLSIRHSQAEHLRAQLAKIHTVRLLDFEE